MDSLYLAWRYLSYHKLRSLVLVACITIIGALPLALEILVIALSAPVGAPEEIFPGNVGNIGGD